MGRTAELATLIADITNELISLRQPNAPYNTNVLCGPRYPSGFVRLIPTNFTGAHPVSYLSDCTPSFFRRFVKYISPSDRSEHRVTVYAIHNPQPNQVCH